MMKATNVQYWNFNRRFEVVKDIEKARNLFRTEESCSKSKSCSKVAQQLMDSPSLKGGPGPSHFKKVATISYMT